MLFSPRILSQTVKRINSNIFATLRCIIRQCSVNKKICATLIFHNAVAHDKDLM